MSETTGRAVGGNPTQVARRVAAREALLKAAIDLLVARGGDAFTLAEVGVRAGFSRGLPGHHFESKTKLVQAVIDRLFAKFATRPLAPEGAGLERLLERLGNYFNGLRQTENERRAFLILMGNAQRDPALLLKLRALNTSTVDVFEKELTAAAQAGDLMEGLDPRRQAILLLASLRGIADIWMADPDGLNLDELRDAFLANVKRGLGARAV